MEWRVKLLREAEEDVETEQMRWVAKKAVLDVERLSGRDGKT